MASSSSSSSRPPNVSSQKFPNTRVNDDLVCDIDIGQLNDEDKLSEAFNTLISFLCEDPIPGDKYQRCFFKETEKSEDGYIKFLKLSGNDSKDSVYVILRAYDGYMLGFIIKKANGWDTGKNPYTVFIMDVPSREKNPASGENINNEETRKQKAARKLNEMGFEDAIKLGFSDGYWAIQQAANLKRNQVIHSKKELLTSFNALLNYGHVVSAASDLRASQEPVARGILFLVQFFLESVRVKLQREIIISSYPNGTLLDDETLSYQNGFSAASFLNRLDMEGLVKEDFVYSFQVNENKSLDFTGFNNIFGGKVLRGGLSRGTKRINLKDEYKDSNTVRKPKK
ncbi:hypothetical protein POM88_001612 [Heracleum sosnowskyi]|uniref:Uncharacterized protein n=1 Tax=Heracleum sosnowskyi TaxID=360622 RepID=A0AAD8JCW2_9APIA|nr:hypothetical protein POM88_001612 [Heracleum sosnowskyi]